MTRRFIILAVLGAALATLPWTQACATQSSTAQCEGEACPAVSLPSGVLSFATTPRTSWNPPPAIVPLPGPATAAGHPPVAVREPLPAHPIPPGAIVLRMLRVVRLIV